MSVRRKSNLYLVHEETGQRYPLDHEVVIGRSGGEIIFADDTQMSSQHCRIFHTPHGLAVNDLGSSNGTVMDGVLLDPDKNYAFKPGSSLLVGQQVFNLMESSYSKKTVRKKKPKTSGWDPLSIVAGTMALTAVLFLSHLVLTKHEKRERPIVGIMRTPFEALEFDMRSAFKDYAELGEAHTRRRINNKTLAQGIRKQLIPKLMSTYTKMGTLRPQNDFEKRKLAANRRLIWSLIDQVEAMASYADTKNPRYQKDLEQFSQIAEAASLEVQKLEATRTPAQSNY